MDKSSQICGILWQNARICGGRSNLLISQIPKWPQKIYSLNITTISTRPTTMTTSNTSTYAHQFHGRFPSVLWRCCLGGRKGIRPVKTEWWDNGVVICLERGANDLHMVQLMPLPPQSSLAPVKSRMVYLSGAGLPRLSWKKAVKQM